MLTRLDAISQDLLSKSAEQLHELLPGPTLLTLDGLIKEPLFLSVLLHGNEDTGWEVVRQFLQDYQGRPLPRALCIFIGNVKAAAHKQRKLDSQPDFNRIWGKSDSPEATVMHTVLNEMREKKVFASIDIHNNTGLNPHYACINSLQAEFLNLARNFSRSIVYFMRPAGVQSIAFSQLCPSVTLECGQAGDKLGIEKARHFVERILLQKNHVSAMPPANDYDLFHTLAIIKIPQHITISFDGSEADLQFIEGIEKHNFEEIEAGTLLARIKSSVKQAFYVQEESGEDIFNNYFIQKDGQLFIRHPIIPSMLTDNLKIVRQDCLCYLMQRYQTEHGEKSLFD